MKYKDGDIVRVRTDLIPYEVYNNYRFLPEMVKYQGECFRVELSCWCDSYDLTFLDGRDVPYCWTDDMLEESPIFYFTEFIRSLSCSK